MKVLELKGTVCFLYFTNTIELELLAYLLLYIKCDECTEVGTKLNGFEEPVTDGLTIGTMVRPLGPSPISRASRSATRSDGSRSRSASAVHSPV